MSRRYTAVITKEPRWFVARCLELDVVSQGETIDKARFNLKEAVDLYIESFGEDGLPESVEEMMIYPMEVLAGA